MDSEIPTVLARIDERGQTIFYCDHCKRNHIHGRGEGHRGAHCDDFDSPYHKTGYNIKYAEGPLKYLSEKCTLKITLFKFDKGIVTYKKKVISPRTSLDNEELKCLDGILQAFFDRNYASVTLECVKMMGLFEMNEIISVEDHQSDCEGIPDFKVFRGMSSEKGIWVEFKCQDDTLRLNQLEKFLELNKKEEEVYLLRVEYKDAGKR